MDFPYGDVPGGPIPSDLSTVPVAQAIVLLAAYGIAGDEKVPLLVFNFVVPGEPEPRRVALALERDQWAKFPLLVQQTVIGALRASNA